MSDLLPFIMAHAPAFAVAGAIAFALGIVVIIVLLIRRASRLPTPPPSSGMFELNARLDAMGELAAELACPAAAAALTRGSTR